jgi:hypothetical protein
MNLRKIIFWITGTSIEEARMLFWRGVFWVFFTAFVGGILFGIVAVYETFGLPAMWIAVFLLYLLYLWTERRKPIYFGDGYDMLWLGDRKPSLPPPGKPQMRPSGTPQIGRASTPLTPSHPGPVARR